MSDSSSLDSSIVVVVFVAVFVFVVVVGVLLMVVVAGAVERSKVSAFPTSTKHLYVIGGSTAALC